MRRRHAVLVGSLAAVVLIGIGSPAFAGVDHVANGATRLHASLKQKTFTLDKHGFHEHLTVTSTLPAGDKIVSWTFKNGDKSPAVDGKGAPPHSFNHTYAHNGHWTASLKVRDSHGRTSTGTFVVRYPGPDWTAPKIVFSALGATSPAPNGTPSVFIEAGRALPFTMAVAAWDGAKSVRLNYGDGSPVVTNPTTFSHVYSRAGNYSLHAFVIDKAGVTGSGGMFVDVEAPQNLFLNGGGFTGSVIEAGLTPVSVSAQRLTTLAGSTYGGPAAGATVALAGDSASSIVPAAAGPFGPSWTVTFATPGVHTLTASEPDVYGVMHTGTLAITVVAGPSVGLSVGNCVADPDPSQEDDCDFSATTSLTTAAGTHEETGWVLTFEDGTSVSDTGDFLTPLTVSGFSSGSHTAVLTLDLDGQAGRTISSSVVSFTAP